jgi:hypothetical protein
MDDIDYMDYMGYTGYGLAPAPAYRCEAGGPFGGPCDARRGSQRQ